jgi:hypothetical protein
MKKTILLIVAAVFSLGVSAQTIIFSSSFESWTAGSPDNWVGSKTNFAGADIIEVTTGTTYGLKAVKLVNQTSTHKRLSTQNITITNGEIYTVKFWAKGQGDVRVGMFDSSNIATTAGFHYEPYNTVNGNTWTQYSQNITCLNTWAGGQFILSVRNTTGTDDIQIDSVVITTAAPPANTPIYDIQYSTANPPASPLVGQQVTTGGLVTGTYASGYFIQDGFGPWRGLHVFDSNNTPSIGDSVVITGYVSEYFDMTQVSSVSAFQVVSTGNTLYAPVVISTSNANTEPYESVLVRVNNATCTNANAGFGMWTVNDGSGECKIHNLIYAYTPSLNTIYQVTGPLYYAFAEFRVEPRNTGDVVVQGTVGLDEIGLEEMVLYPNPSGNTLNFNTLNTNTQLIVVDVSGREVLNSFVLLGISQYDISMLESGVYTLLVYSGRQVKALKFIKE